MNAEPLKKATEPWDWKVIDNNGDLLATANDLPSAEKLRYAIQNIELVGEEYRKSTNYNKSYSDANKLLHEEKEALESLNRDLVEALEFYAEEKNHDATELVCHSGDEPLHISLVYEDYGKRAKKVLEKAVTK